MSGERRGGGRGHVVDPAVARVADPSADDEVETGVPVDDDQNDDQQRNQTKDVRMIRLRFDFVGEFEGAIDPEQPVETQRRQKSKFRDEIEKIRGQKRNDVEEKGATLHVMSP